MYLFQTDGQWLAECCLICGSVNHIFLSDPEAHAWECWACFNRWWLDDLAEDMLIINNNIDENETENMLKDTHPLVKILYGHCERVDNE